MARDLQKAIKVCARNKIKQRANSKMLQLQVFVAVIVCLHAGSSSAELVAASSSAEVKLYVTPTGQHCNNYRPCHTLSEYLGDQDYWFNSGTALHFLPGNHTVNSSISVAIKDIENFSVTALASSELASASAPPVQIQCKGLLEFCFVNVTNLEISGIIFIECGLEYPTALRDQNRSCHFPIKYGKTSNVSSNAALGLNGTRGFVLKDVHILDSNGYGIAAVDMRGESSIMGCKFHNNKWTGPRLMSANGGNALFVFSKPFDTLRISHCNFSDGVNTDDAYYQSGSGGLGIIFYQDEFKQVRLGSTSVFISKCRFLNNTAVKGGNMFVAANIGWIYKDQHKIDLKNCIFSKGEASLHGGAVYIESVREDNGRYHSQWRQEVALHVTNCVFIYNLAEKGGALFFKSSLFSVYVVINTSHICHNHAKEGAGVYGMLDKKFKKVIAVTVYITESRFTNNTATTSGGGTYFHLHNNASNFTITACNFTRNYATFGSAIAFVGSSMNAINETNIHLSHSNFTYNSVLESHYNSAVLDLDKLRCNFQLTTCNFIDNNSSAVYTDTATLHLQGSIRIIGNRAVAGGAFHMDCSSLGQSQLMFNDVDLFISNNTAEQYGGGIDILEHCSFYRSCFFGIHGDDEPRITMSGNRAKIAGDSIYGGSLESCIYTNSSGSEIPLTQFAFKQIFGKDNSHSPSEISSPSYAVSFCSASPAGSTCTTTEKKVFPGKEFSVPAATTGQYGGTSPAIVRTQLIISNNTAGQLGPKQNVQCFGRERGELTYLINTTADHAKLHLLIETALGPWHAPSVIDIVFLPCPFGFELNGITSKCDCASHLRAPGVICNINSQTIHRPASMWIGNYSGDLILHHNCPFDYCQPVGGDISLSDQDAQCSFNRSGILCGSCLPGLSTCLGSSKCLECSNTYLLLIVPFAVAGMALVFLLLMCNLTVSTGTINGLIFYANIVRKNHSIFFPTGHKNFITRILEVFIAWLNLDLGIETCFFHGMDTYAKTWLQFIFPVYIWMLAGCIIYSNRYSITISKLTAKNAVPTLATLFLLSYAKLLHAIIATISPITLVNKHGSSSLVWLRDGNVAYVEGAHIALFAMALMATVLYIVPFTLLLLLAPCLQACSSHLLLRWVNRQKPLLDAYQGPYNTNFRSWTGVMLLLRVVLFAIFAGNAFGNPQVNLIAIAIVILAVSMVLNCLKFNLYKRRFVQFLEGFFLSNLAIFAVATIFLKNSPSYFENQEILTDVMVGSAFIVFIIIMVYHFYQRVRETAVVHKLVACCRNVHSDHENDIQNSIGTAVSRPPNVTVVDLQSCKSNELEMRSFELREPLLTDERH